MSMTVEEAIAKFKRTSVLWESASNTEMVEAVKTAISALEEVQELHAIGTVSEFRELKEKATAKKPKKIKRHRGGFEMEHCPNCDTDYQVDRRFEVEEDYCGNCGKLLDSSFINFCANCGCPVDMSKGKE